MNWTGAPDHPAKMCGPQKGLSFEYYFLRFITTIGNILDKLDDWRA